MSRLSIYSQGWINLVFEGRNQQYGAFRLRQKSDETTLLAFCLGVSLIAMVATIPMLISSFNSYNSNEITDPVFDSPQIHLTNIQLTTPPKPVKTALPIHRKKPEGPIEKKQLVNPVIVKPDQPVSNLAKNNEPVNTPSGSNDSNPNKANVSGPVTSPGIHPTQPVFTSSDDKEILNTLSVDKVPEFPGGINAFCSYVGENFEKPEIEETISVLMAFVVEKDGSMTDIRVLRSGSPSIDREAIRVLKALKTKWKPGLKNGQPVRTEYKLPIKVKK